MMRQVECELVWHTRRTEELGEQVLGGTCEDGVLRSHPGSRCFLLKCAQCYGVLARTADLQSCRVVTNAMITDELAKNTQHTIFCVKKQKQNRIIPLRCTPAPTVTEQQFDAVDGVGICCATDAMSNCRCRMAVAAAVPHTRARTRAALGLV